MTILWMVRMLLLEICDRIARGVWKSPEKRWLPLRGEHSGKQADLIQGYLSRAKRKTS